MATSKEALSALQSKINRLELQIESPGISAAERIAIHQRLTELQKKENMLLLSQQQGKSPNF